MGIADRVRRIREGLASAAVNGHAMRLDVATGEQLWRRGVAKGPSPIAHHAGTLWVGGGDGLLGFDASAGTQTAEVDVPGRAVALAAGAAGVWAVVDGERVVGIEPGAARIVAEAATGHATRIAVGTDAVWVSCPARYAGTSAVVALDPTGAERWRAGVGGRPAGLAQSDRVVWVARASSATGHIGGAVLALDAATGEVVAELAAFATVSEVAVADRAVFAAARGGDATVVKLDAEGGRRLAGVDAPDRAAVLAADRGTVWVASWRADLRRRKGIAAIRRVDARSARVVDTWEVGHTPIDVAASPDGLWITTFDTVDSATDVAAWTGLS